MREDRERGHEQEAKNPGLTRLLGGLRPGALDGLQHMREKGLRDNEAGFLSL